ncbi:hypothetical protein Daus18300_014298 [Diaporthe australafricana]|uniref:Peptidase C14 caspase domain-containing protein n=1 Tax=Diaporthe australafricana TaxID=127596 RepID=A0ABR3VVS9_9PEZI
MSHRKNKRRQKWAVLIGIEHYEPTRRPAPNLKPRQDDSGNEIRYRNLHGCVNDVLAVEKYLVDTIKIKAAKIKRLIAPTPGRSYISELPKDYLEPTYANIIDALKVPDGARKGDLMYIHFSGHGGRATTIFDSSLKNSDFDEALVPVDIVSGGDYLRDLELGMLLQELEDAGLIVTVVLDCCHSGGAVRGDDNPQLGSPRGIEGVYKSEATRDQPSHFDRIQSFGKYVESRRRYNTRGVVVLAACLESQLAREKLDGRHSYGLLTHCLLDTLKNIDRPRRISTQTLYQRIRASVQASNKYQTPYLVGSEGRFFFTKTLGSTIYPLSVVSISIDISRSMHDRFIRLEGGKLHAVKLQSRYAILPYGFKFGKGHRERDVLAQVRVLSVTDGEAKSQVVSMDDARWNQIIIGCPAILQELPACEKFTVAFVNHGDDRSIVDTVEEAWKEHEGNKTWLSLCSRDTRDASFIVSLDGNKNLKIHDARGSFNTTPWDDFEPLPYTNMPELLRQLEHIARFTVIKELGRLPSFSSPRLVSVTVRNAAPGKPGHYYGQTIPPGHLTKLEDGACEHAYEVEAETGFNITVKNESQRSLGCVILDCGSDFSVERVYPVDRKFQILEVGQEITTTLAMAISPLQLKSAKAGEAVIDTLKVMVCHPEMIMDSLQLPGLFEAPDRAGQISSLDGLRTLLQELDTARPAFVVRDRTTEFDNWEAIDIKMSVRPSEN